MPRLLPSRPRTRAVALAAAVAALLGSVGLRGVDKPHSSQPVVLAAATTSGSALRAALLQEGRCGKFATTLPALVDEVDVQPGSKSDPVRVCLRNDGGSGAAVWLSVASLVDAEIGCGPEERSVDATCGAGGAGELAAVLDQLVGVDARCSSTASALTRQSLGSLQRQPLLLVSRLAPRALVCVALRAEHAADLTTAEGTAAAMRADSDSVRWTYAFTATG